VARTYLSAFLQIMLTVTCKVRIYKMYPPGVFDEKALEYVLLNREMIQKRKIKIL
jgi:hypothetical protein